MESNIGDVIIVETNADNEYIVRSYQQKLGEAVGKMYAMARKERGFTQQEVSDVSGVKRPNIARLEAGKHSPTVDMLARVADSMGMHLELRLVDKPTEE